MGPRDGAEEHAQSLGPIPAPGANVGRVVLWLYWDDLCRHAGMTPEAHRVAAVWAGCWSSAGPADQPRGKPNDFRRRILTGCVRGREAPTPPSLLIHLSLDALDGSGSNAKIRRHTANTLAGSQFFADRLLCGFGHFWPPDVLPLGHCPGHA
jgi:hypothetical protein